jgi:hypothetical protein
MASQIPSPTKINLPSSGTSASTPKASLSATAKKLPHKKPSLTGHESLPYIAGFAIGKLFGGKGQSPQLFKQFRQDFIQQRLADKMGRVKKLDLSGGAKPSGLPSMSPAKTAKFGERFNEEWGKVVEGLMGPQQKTLAEAPKALFPSAPGIPHPSESMLAKGSRKDQEERGALEQAKLGKLPLRIAGKFHEEAKAYGLNASSLHKSAADIRQQQHSQADEFNEMLSQAREMMRSKTFQERHGGHGQLMGMERYEDADSVKGFDEVVAEEGPRFQHLLGNEDQWEANLFNALKQGRQEKISHESAYEQALEQMRSEKEQLAGREPGEDEPVAHARRRHPDEELVPFRRSIPAYFALPQMSEMAKLTKQLHESVGGGSKPLGGSEEAFKMISEHMEKLSKLPRLEIAHIWHVGLEGAQKFPSRLAYLNAIRQRIIGRLGAADRVHAEDEPPVLFTSPYNTVDEDLWEECKAIIPPFQPPMLPWYAGKIDGNDLYFVDGDKIKIEDDMDFHEANNGEETEWVRKQYGRRGVIVDAREDRHEWAVNLYHECHETRLMRKGMPYDIAHEHANHCERQLRRRIKHERLGLVPLA